VLSNRLKWFELRLGRLPHALAWHEVDLAVKGVLTDQGYPSKRLTSWEMEFDVITGILFLKTDLWQLRQLSRLPRRARPAWNCFMSRLRSGSRLGTRTSCRRFSEMTRLAWSGKGSERFFAKWRDQPAAQDLPPGPTLWESRKVEMKSSILGCKIIVESENTPPCVDLAESVLAALEGLLATGMDAGVVAENLS